MRPEAGAAVRGTGLELAPLDTTALQLKPHLLGGRLDRSADAIAALDRVIKLYPEHVQSLAWRAVAKACAKVRTVEGTRFGAMMVIAAVSVVW